MEIRTSPTPSAKVIGALTCYDPHGTYYIQTFEDERGFYVSINGIHIRPPLEEAIDTRRKALQWTLELYRL